MIRLVWVFIVLGKKRIRETFPPLLERVSRACRYLVHFLPLLTPSLFAVYQLAVACHIRWQCHFLYPSVENVLKLSLVRWECLVSIPTKIQDHFLLFPSASCVPSWTECGASTPPPPTPFPILEKKNTDTPRVFLSHTLLHSRRGQMDDKRKF